MGGPILDGATSGDGLGAVLILRSQPKILREIQKNISPQSPAFCMYALGHLSYERS